VQSELIIKLLNGSEHHGILSQEFDPVSGQITFFCHAEKRSNTLELNEICFIKFLGRPELDESADDGEFFEDVATRTGQCFHLRLKKSGKRVPQGFFGFPIDNSSDFKSIFFTSKGYTNRHHDQLLGEVLSRQGLVEEADIKDALTEQKKLRSRRVGEILAEQAELSKTVLEKVIHNATRDGKRPQTRVGDILIDAGLVTRKQVDEALNAQNTGKRKRIGLILIERGLITEDQLLVALSRKFGLKIIDLDDITVNPQAFSKVPRDMIERMQILPFALQGNRLTVATSTPTDSTITENLRFATNCQIELVCAQATQIGERISELCDEGDGSIDELIEELDDVDIEHDEVLELDRINESDSKVINLVNKVLLDASKKGVSDIHFEPGAGTQPLNIRYRKDGICYVVHRINATYKAAVISRIKIIAKLDIAERRRPQSGKILLRQGTERIEYRVEITPTIGGQEDAVLRVLSSSRLFPLDKLGFSANNMQRLQELLKRPYGIILCVGPTGAGKTTSLHSILAEINTPDTKIWTAEDPVEIIQEGLRQVQVYPKIGFTFEEALRSFLRADPDVIMIGEMRDPSTAKIAIGASLTGHRVFSTLHTNNAPETVVRLIEMGMDPFNFADAMLGILAQRLARRLCKDCKEPYHPDRAEYDELVMAYGAEEFREDNLPVFSRDLTLMKAVGCKECEGQGYSGRIAIHELLINSPQIKHAIKHSAGVEEIADIAMAQGMRRLRMDGIQKIFLGLTDFHQVGQVSA